MAFSELSNRVIGCAIEAHRLPIPESTVFKIISDIYGRIK